MTEGREEVWIGLAKVRQRPGAGVLMDRNEAFVNVLACANDEAGFQGTVEQGLSYIGFDLVELEDSEPLHQRQENYVVDEELLALADEVRSSGSPRFGSFHTWVSDEENG